MYFRSEEQMLLVEIYVNDEPLKRLVEHEKSSISGLDPRKPFNHQPPPCVLDADQYCEVMLVG